MNSHTSNRFEIIKYFKSPRTLLVFFYIYISLIGFLYTIFYNSGIKIDLIKYYVLTDFLLIGIINYKVLFFAISVMIIAYNLIAETQIYFIQRFREVGYGEKFDPDSKRWILWETKKSIVRALLIRLPMFILLILSMIHYRSKPQGTFVLLFVTGVLYYLILIFVKKIRSRSGYVDEFNTIVFSLVTILGLFVGIILGYSDRNKPQKYDYVRIKTENKTIEGELIGTSKKYVFFNDSTIHVINKDLIELIEHIPIDSLIKQPNIQSVTPKLDNDKTDTLLQSE